ncbi:ElaB/YqjD/DUF883 family membrane-anchored ribosome-binding protein [Methylovorus glucosotrophus]|uniref:DUF883 family protein n=1 Tax=Methylovorus glucosotrophus TaxID=266009 RepID=UPI00133157D1|nr:DUF883 family protein [Methylovorus glucosotrophus]KAF0842829.1 ElaB/YqjD/DUF883 family membrane-anchored ribosome-binding protein [Methylovorus glucosotrophus]
MDEIKTTNSREQLIADFQVAVADAEALLKATANQGGEQLAQIRDKVEKSLGVVKVNMAEAQTAIIAKTREAAKATDEYVHENPWEAIGIGAAVGVAIGWLIGRRAP